MKRTIVSIVVGAMLKEDFFNPIGFVSNPLLPKPIKKIVKTGETFSYRKCIIEGNGHVHQYKCEY